MSMEPTVSPALWTTIASGKEPDQHGVTGFLAEREDGEEVPITSNLRRTETLWTIASASGRRVTVVGWYVTWPVEAVNGAMVSDRFLAVERGDLVGGPVPSTGDGHGVYPADRAGELADLFVRPADFLHPDERRFHETVTVYPVDETRVASAEHLLQADPVPDLAMFYLWGVDPMQHYFWKFHEPETWVGPPMSDREIEDFREMIPDYYRDTDAFLARLLAGVGPRDTVIVVSDHGAGPVRVFDATKPPGEHRLEGIIIAAGNHIRRGTADRVPSIVDVAPTVLHLLGLPVGADMRGQVILDMMDPAFLADHPVEMIPTHEPEERRETKTAVPSAMDEQIKKQLRSLGYIE
jgi:predicted AlkP superfamily phosphohydrolase/phosphomutase